MYKRRALNKRSSRKMFKRGSKKKKKNFQSTTPGISRGGIRL